MTRVRLFTLTVFALGLMPLVGAIFGTFVVVALLPLVVVASVGVLTSEQRFPVAAVAIAVGLVAATIATTFVAGGRSVDEFVFAFGPAFSRLFTTTWPSPQRPELVGLTSMLAGAAVGASHLVGRFERYRIVALMPTLAAAAFLTVAGAASGPHVLVWCWFLIAGVAYLVLSTKSATLRQPDSQVTVVGALAVTVAVALGALLPSTGRYDPRRSEVEELDAFVPPTQDFANLQELDPPSVLFEVGGDTDGLERLRTIVYDVYDGSQWQVGFDFEEVGTVVRAGAAADRNYTVWPLDERMHFLPFAGQPVRVDARIAADRDRNVVALLDEDVTSRIIQISTYSGDDDAAPAEGPAVATAISAPFSAAANEVVGNAEDLTTQLDVLADSMRREWKLNPPEEPSPMQSKLLAEFVTQTNRGGAAQFVAGFVLMAQTLGADARMVGGFVLDDSARTNDGVVIDSSDAKLWAEVRTEAGGWRTYDPVPLTVSRDENEDEAAPPPVEEAGARPPTVFPPENDPNTDDNPELAPDSGRSWPSWVSLAVSAVVLAAAMVVLLVTFKGARRWYWMSLGNAARRTRGAWAEATSTLIDAGLPVRESWTDMDIVRRSASIDGVARDDVARLAQAARIVAFSPAVPNISSRELAAGRAAVRSLRSGIRSGRSWRDRVRMRMSVRSVWPTTRTPVLRKE